MMDAEFYGLATVAARLMLSLKATEERVAQLEKELAEYKNAREQ